MVPRPRRLVLASLWLAAAQVFGFVPRLLAQVSPNGSELQFNSYTTGAQHQPALALGAQGTFVVAWNSFGSGGTDTSSYSVQVRRFDAVGVPLGVETQVNTFTTDDQGLPAVASDGLGRFVVVWQSLGSAGNDGSQTSIQGQRFEADGTPLGPEFQVNTYTTSYQESPAVAADAAGGFVVVWESLGSPDSDVSEWSIQGQRFGDNGAPIGAQFQVNTYTTDRQIHPAIAMDPVGNFVVAWSSFGSTGNDNSANSIQAQRFEAAGAPTGAEFQVNTYTTDRQIHPAIAMDPLGNFLVVWGSVGSFGTDTASSSIQGQRFAFTGAPLGVQFQVNTYTSFNQHQPTVAIDGRGDFVVAWQSEGSDGGDTSDYSIHVQRFRAGGSALDAEVQVNTYTTGHQGQPAALADGLGNFVVSWGSDGSFATDTDQASVLAQLFDGLFRDGFETGGTSRWSAAVP